MVDLGCPPEFANPFRHHHLWLLEEVVNAAQHEVCFDNIANILQ